MDCVRSKPHGIEAAVLDDLRWNDMTDQSGVALDEKACLACARFWCELHGPFLPDQLANFSYEHMYRTFMDPATTLDDWRQRIAASMREWVDRGLFETHDDGRFWLKGCRPLEQGSGSGAGLQYRHWPLVGRLFP
jgi:hypothetical protein